MSELQTEQVDNGVKLDTDNIETETIVDEAAGTDDLSGSDLAPDTEEKQEKSEHLDQDKANHAINKQHAKYREEERKRKASDARVAELEEKLGKLDAEPADVIIPPLPDPYDEDFTEKMEARDAALVQKTQQDATKQSAQAGKEAQRVEAEQANQTRIDNLVTGYDENATKLGLNIDAIKAAGAKVVEYGISGELAEFILADEDGPLITQYLADNPIELDKFNTMSPINAALRINSVIRQAASKRKPQVSAAPDPTEVLSGNGAPPKESPFLAGATFE